MPTVNQVGLLSPRAWHIYNDTGCSLTFSALWYETYFSTLSDDTFYCQIISKLKMRNVCVYLWLIGHKRSKWHMKLTNVFILFYAINWLMMVKVVAALLAQNAESASG